MILYGQPDTSELSDADIANGNNNMVICPLCWTERYDKMPDYGYLPPECEVDGDGNIIINPQCMAVMKMTLDADKVFDFYNNGMRYSKPCLTWHGFLFK